MNLQPYLDRLGIGYHLSHHPAIYTAQELAEIEHISGHQVIKPVLVEADGQPVLCVLPASHRVDLGALRRELGCEELRLGDEGMMGDLFEDCDLGAEPPVGAIFGLPTIMDESLFNVPEVTFQAGSHTDAVTISLSDYRRLAQPGIGHFGVLAN